MMGGIRSGRAGGAPGGAGPARKLGPAVRVRPAEAVPDAGASGGSLEPGTESPGASGSPRWESRVRSAERSISDGLAAIANRRGARNVARAAARELEADLSRAVSPLLSRSRDGSPEREAGAPSPPRLLDFGFDSVAQRGEGAAADVAAAAPAARAGGFVDVGLGTPAAAAADAGPSGARRRGLCRGKAQLSAAEIAEHLQLLVLLGKSGDELVRLQAEDVSDVTCVTSRARAAGSTASSGEEDAEAIADLWLPEKHREGDFKLQHARVREVGGRLKSLRALQKEAKALLESEGGGSCEAGVPGVPPGAPSTPAASPALSALSARSPLYTPPKGHAGGRDVPPRVEGFFPADFFDGSQRGYFFGTGEAGLGYYPDLRGGYARSAPLPGEVGPDGKWRAQVAGQSLKRMGQLSKLRTLKVEAELLFQ